MDDRQTLITQLFVGTVAKILGYERTKKLWEESTKTIDKNIKSGVLKVKKDDKC